MNKLQADNTIGRLEAEIERLREALKRISEIEDQYLSGDWQEIDEARNIATSALEGSSYGNKIHKQGEA